MAEIIIGKQRNGPIGTVKLAFLKQYTRFENCAGRGSSNRDPSDRRARRSRGDPIQLRAPSPQFLSSAASPPPGIIAVVKANAYGHGAAQVGLALEAAGAAMLACADIEEGDRAARRPACRCRSWCSAR